MVVSGSTKEGEWKENHASTLPEMFKKHCRIFAEQLESRCKVNCTPHKNTLLALKLDPSVNTTEEDGIFSSRTAAHKLMMGEYSSRLIRRHKLMFAAATGAVVSSVSGPQRNSQLVPAKRAAPSIGGLPRRGQRVSSHVSVT